MARSLRSRGGRSKRRSARSARKTHDANAASLELSLQLRPRRPDRVRHREGMQALLRRPTRRPGFPARHPPILRRPEDSRQVRGCALEQISTFTRAAFSATRAAFSAFSDTVRQSTLAPRLHHSESRRRGPRLALSRAAGGSRSRQAQRRIPSSSGRLACSAWRRSWRCPTCLHSVSRCGIALRAWRCGGHRQAEPLALLTCVRRSSQARIAFEGRSRAERPLRWVRPRGSVSDRPHVNWRRAVGQLHCWPGQGRVSI
jgi:hypothetical protein